MADVEEALALLRSKIDDLDDRILEVLNERASLVIEVGKLKEKEKIDVYVPERERRIYERLIKNNKGPLPDQSLKNVFREIISASLSLEKRLTVAFLGPLATFTHLACMKHFGLSATFIPKKDISDVFDDVERRRANYGVVPIESTTEGVVTHTLDMFISSDLKICAEVFMEVQLVLMNKTGRWEDISMVYSNPHAIAGCKEWLKKNMPGILVQDVSSTAMAAKMASEDPSVAAIASEAAAELYDLTAVERNIQDEINNFTRFLVIGRQIPDKSGIDKTSIMFLVKDSPGVLYKILEPFSKGGINLTKIESRPLKKKAWEYVFFLDMEGHVTDENLSKALKKLDKKTISMRVLGSYPKSIER